MGERVMHRPETEEAHERAVARVIGVMRERLYDGFSLTEMAEEGYMSPFHFNRVFRQVTGVPPVQFFGGLRLRRAKRLLAETDASVTDVCFDVGYNSLGTFSRRFGELVGTSPSRFREIARSGESGGPLPVVPSSAPVSTDPSGPGVFGRVAAAGYRGPVFVGLFEEGLPQGRPAACAVLAAPGPFRLRPKADGVYSLFAAGLGERPSPKTSLLCEDALRGGGRDCKVVVRGGRAGGPPIEVELRSPDPVDPPILLTLPVLIGEHLARNGDGGLADRRWRAAANGRPKGA